MAAVMPLRPEEQPRGAVSNAVYDVVTVFQNKLEALAAYEKYIQDCAGDQESRRVLDQIRSDDERHIHLLRDHIEKMCREGRFH